jgi:hypothetical protein
VLKWRRTRLSEYLSGSIFSSYSVATQKPCTDIKLLIPLSRCYPDSNKKLTPPFLALTMTKTHHTNCYPNTSGAGEVRGRSQTYDPHNNNGSIFFVNTVHLLVIAIFPRYRKAEPLRHLLTLLLTYSAKCDKRKLFCVSFKRSARGPTHTLLFCSSCMVILSFCAV